MEPEKERDPFEKYNFQGSEIVYDLIYSPEETRFLSRAKERGCTVCNGRNMLLAQGHRQFEQFSGIPYPARV